MNRASVSFLFLLSACLAVTRPVSAEEPRPPVRAEKPIKLDRRGEEGFRAIYTIDPDGSSVQFLVAAPGIVVSASPEISRDGKKIVFDGVPQVQQTQLSHIYVADIEGISQASVKDLGLGWAPTWSPDGQRIAFAITDGNPEKVAAGVWMMNSDGSGRKRLCDGWCPRWSPLGREICVYAYQDRPPRLHFVDVETGQIRIILGEEISAGYGGVTWSPDGKRVVFVGATENRSHIAVMDVDGNPDSLAILYSTNNAREFLMGAPAWSPDGKDVVFAIQASDASRERKRAWMDTYLYTISAEAPSAPKLLEPEKIGSINRGMMWFPDGRKIVFSSER